MSFLEMVFIEFKKVKRSKILPLILIPPLLVVISGISSLSQYLSDESEGVWSAMFVQCGLLFSYYLLPFSMVVVCVMISQREIQNNGILKMLALPIQHKKLALSKLVVVLCYLALEVVLFFSIFVISGIMATQMLDINEAFPIGYILKWSVYLFATAIPFTTVIWMITVLFRKPLFSIGLNMLFIIPGVLVANTSAWLIYPYCYGGYLISTELERVSLGAAEETFEFFPFIPCAIAIFLVALIITVQRFGKKEMK
ncbi:ABC transporter permease [Bacillus sp. FJAT-52991]|uniref:ABC transporter permease n=1 Tax=Bacillus kandeliae TaxID=3129297 RepID=A0ABZ2NAX3_9BACI